MNEKYGCLIEPMGKLSVLSSATSRVPLSIDFPRRPRHNSLASATRKFIDFAEEFNRLTCRCRAEKKFVTKVGEKRVVQVLKADLVAKKRFQSRIAPMVEETRMLLSSKTVKIQTPSKFSSRLNLPLS